MSSMRQLLEAGVHFGHQTHRWNPKMAPFIYGSRNNIHIIDLTQTVPLLAPGAARGGRHRRQRRPRAVRRHQAAGPEAVADAARVLRAVLRQPPLARRHADQLAHHLATRSRGSSRSKSCWPASTQGLTKKELLQLTREKDKLERSLGGIKDMGAPPDMMFVIDTNKEAIAIAEARKLGIPVVAVVDSNCDPGRHQPSDPRQRRRRPRHHALLRPDRARRHRRHRAGARLGRRRSRRRRRAARRARARRGRGRRRGRRAPSTDGERRPQRRRPRPARRKSRQRQGPVAGEAAPQGDRGRAPKRKPE